MTGASVSTRDEAVQTSHLVGSGFSAFAKDSSWQAGRWKLKAAWGQEVASLVNGAMMTAGRHTITFDAGSLPSGLYLYKLEVNGFSAQNKMMLMK